MELKGSNLVLVGDMSTGRKEAFELFKRDHELYQKMEKERRDLRLLHLDARRLGEELKQSKALLGSYHQFSFHFIKIFLCL